MKELVKQYFDIYFLALVVLELMFVQFYPAGRIITKPLLLISLMGYYATSSKSIDWLFFIGLFFAFLGDTFLLSDDFFLFGLGSFLVMQLIYIVCFFKHKGPTNIYKVLGGIFISVLTGIMLYTLIPSLDDGMRIPVIVYSVSIGLMAIGAILRSHNGIHYPLILIGVISFLISDSILGLNKFGDGFRFAGLLVMLTYIIAQYLIVKGYLRYQSSNNDRH